MAIENRGPEFQNIVIGFYVVAFVTMALRCYTRHIIMRGFGLDDWLMLLSMTCFTVHSTWALLGVHYGTGRHFDDLSPEGIKKAMMYWWFSYSGYTTTMTSSKFSIGIFLLRITDHNKKAIHNKIIYANLILAGLAGFVFFFACIFQCWPVSYFWNRDQPGRCISLEVIIKLTYAYSACSVITDGTFAILPIFIVWRLNMRKRTKWLLTPVFAMAFSASTAVVVRLAYVPDFVDPDYLWATLDIANWSTVEMGLAITAGSLVTLRPLIKQVSVALNLTAKSSSSPSYPEDNPKPRIAFHRNGTSLLSSRNETYQMLTLDHLHIPLSQLRQDIEAVAGTQYGLAITKDTTEVDANEVSPLRNVIIPARGRVSRRQELLGDEELRTKHMTA